MSVFAYRISHGFDVARPGNGGIKVSPVPGCLECSSHKVGNTCGAMREVRGVKRPGNVFHRLPSQTALGLFCHF